MTIEPEAATVKGMSRPPRLRIRSARRTSPPRAPYRAVLRPDASNPGAQNELQLVSLAQAYRIDHAQRSRLAMPRRSRGLTYPFRFEGTFLRAGSEGDTQRREGPGGRIARPSAEDEAFRAHDPGVGSRGAPALRSPRVQRRDRGRDRRRSAHLGPDVLSLLPQQGRRAAGAHRPAQQEPSSSAVRPTGQRGTTGITSPGARRTARHGRPRARAALDRHHHRQPVGAELRPRWASN